MRILFHNGAQHSKAPGRSTDENVSRTSKTSRWLGTATSEQTHQADSKTALDGHGRGGEESTGGGGAVRRRACRQRARHIARDGLRPHRRFRGRKTPNTGAALSSLLIGARKTRTHFAHRIDMLDAAGEIQEHLTGVEDYELAASVWLAAVKRWPRDIIILRQGARVMRDSRRPRVVK